MTHETSASIDEQAMRVTRTVTVRAPIETVWNVLTEPTNMNEWFSERFEFPHGTHEGAEGAMVSDEWGTLPIRIATSKPPTSFAFTWGTPGENIRPDNSTTATFSLESVGDTTRLSVVETGFDHIVDDQARSRSLTDHASGWTSQLDQLIAFAEGAPRADNP